MPIGYSSTVKTALAGGVLRPRIFLAIEGVLNWWDGRGRDLSWDSTTWRGAGPILQISANQLEADSGSKNIQIEISALDPDIRAIAAGDHFLAKVRLYNFFLDSSGDIIPDPVLVYSERIDYMVVLRRESSATLLINCENETILMGQSAPKLRTHQDQLAEHPGDNFYKHVARLPDNPLHVLVGYRPPLSL